MERIRKDDHTENGWMTSGNSVRGRLYTNFIELLETAPTGVEPMVMMMMVMMMMMMMMMLIMAMIMMRS